MEARFLSGRANIFDKSYKFCFIEMKYFLKKFPKIHLALICKTRFFTSIKKPEHVLHSYAAKQENLA